MEVHLREASTAEAPRLLELARAAYGRYVERIGREVHPMVDDYEAAIREKSVTVAERDDRIVGFVILTTGDEGFLLYNVAVDLAVEGSGVGRALLEHAEAEARRAGCDSLYLFTHELMTENQALYSRIGYEEYARRVDGDAILVYMRKPLPPSRPNRPETR